MKRILLSILLIGILLVSACGISQSEYGAVIAERDKAVAQIAQLEEYITQLQEKTCELTHFESIYELEKFLREDDTDKIDDPQWLCWNYALTLQRNAFAKGKIINFVSVYWTEYNPLFLGNYPEGTHHAINSAIINNRVWWIEPQSDEIVYIDYLTEKE